MNKNNHEIVLEAIDSFLKNSSQGTGAVINQASMSFFIEKLKLVDWTKQGGPDGQNQCSFFNQ